MSKALQVVPASKIFNYHLVHAHQVFMCGGEPEWFRQHFEEQYIKSEYRIRPKIPLILTLALHLSHESVTPKDGQKTAAGRDSREYDKKYFQEKIEQTKSRLREARARLLELKGSVFNPLV